MLGSKGHVQLEQYQCVLTTFKLLIMCSSPEHDVKSLLGLCPLAQVKQHALGLAALLLEHTQRPTYPHSTTPLPSW